MILGTLRCANTFSKDIAVTEMNACFRTDPDDNKEFDPEYEEEDDDGENDHYVQDCSQEEDEEECCEGEDYDYDWEDEEEEEEEEEAASEVDTEEDFAGAGVAVCTPCLVEASKPEGQKEGRNEIVARAHKASPLNQSGGERKDHRHLSTNSSGVGLLFSRM